MPTYKTSELFGDDFVTPESIGWEQAPQAVPYMLRAVDIAMGGPLVRGLLGAPASIPEAETQTEVQPTSIRQGLMRTSEELFGGLEASMPEVGERSQVPAEFAREILPTAAELALYPSAARVTGAAAGIAGRAVVRGAKTTAELFPELTEVAGRQLASETGAVTLKEPDKYAGSINLERLNIPETQKNYITRVYETNQELMDSARRGVVTHEETLAKAEELLAGDLGVEGLKWKKGKVFNAEEITAARLKLAESTGEVARLSRMVTQGNNSDEMLGNLIIAIKNQLETQTKVGAIATEAGRALSAMRIPAEAGDLRQAYLQKMIAAMGGREITEDIAARLAASAEAGPIAVSRFIRDVTKPNFKDMAFELWINGLLSGPVTHEANTISNALTYLLKFPERAASAAIEAGRALVTRTPRERFFGELPAQAVGIWQGLKEGVKRAIFAFRHGVGPEDVSKLEYRMGAIPGKVGEVVRTPSRALVAADEFFKSVSFESELYAGAYRVAQGMGGSETIPQRMAQILADPPASLVDLAKKEATYRTFQSELGTAGKAISLARSRIPGARYIVPFIRTPINVAKFGLERTPLNVARTIYQAARGKISGAEISDELAKGAVGSLIGATVYMYAKEGKVAGGGPEDKSRRDALRRTGWQPYSVKIGDNWYSYNRLEPVGSVMGLAADFAEVEDLMKDDNEKSDLVTRIGQSVAQNLTSKTFLAGLSDLMNAIDDPQRYGEQYAKSLTGTLVPTASAQLARAMDPTLRRTNDIMGGIKTRIPGVSEGVLPQLNLWGQHIERPARGLAALFPVVASGEKRDKVDREIVRLRLNFELPGKSIQGVKLDPEQHNQYIRLSGEWGKEKLDRLINDPSWDKRSDYAKERVIRDVINDGRERARDLMMRLYPELKEEAKANRKR